MIGADDEIRVAGHDLVREPDAILAAIGVKGQFSAADNLHTGEENLRQMADLHHLNRFVAGSVLPSYEVLDLAEAARRPPASTYSGGMRRRLDLTMALVGDAQRILLDEPATGLDPGAAAKCGASSATWSQGTDELPPVVSHPVHRAAPSG